MPASDSGAARPPLADGLAAVFAAELDEQLRAAVAAWPRVTAAATRPEACRELARIFHTIKGGAGLVGRTELAAAALTLERFFADPDAASAPEQAVVDTVFAAASLPPPALGALLQALLSEEAGAVAVAAPLVPLALGELWLALPLAVVESARAINTPEPSLPIAAGDRELAALRLNELVGGPPPPARAVALVLRAGWALIVDRVRPPVSLVVEPPNRLLALHPWLAGATVDPRGRALAVLDPERLLEAFSSRAAAGQAAAAGSRRVLVVDDSLVAREAAAAALREAGVTFDVARDGREALLKLERGHYAVVLSDLEMPHLDGFGLVEKLRANARLRDQPVVVCSSRLDDDARRRLSPFAVDGFVDKPFVAGELLAALRPWLAANGDAAG
jgi:CheY-like chemotaxis protein/HPt (histidine-containing phosphotransfer) domain-containing protein